MNLAVKSVLIGALLLGNAHAAERGVVSSGAEPQPGKGLDKVAAVQPAQSAGKKTRTAQSNKSNLTAKPGDEDKTDPAAKEKHEGVTENPSDATEQSVQLNGVRG